MNANLASIMPQVVGGLVRAGGPRGHARLLHRRGGPAEELPADIDLLFIGAFTEAAQLAYALSNLFRQRGAITVLGGPHARCYPEDARVLRLRAGLHRPAVAATRCSRTACPHRPMGRVLAAARQPAALPSLAARWKFMEPTLAKSPVIKFVPMIGSLGCPYTCSFCIDSTVDYQPLDFEALSEDLAFLLTKVRHPIVGWHDPNFGVRFDDYMDAIEAAVPPGRMRHIAESSLSLLSEPHLQRLRQNGFQAILPGIESWFDAGQQVEDPAHRDGQGPPVRRAREPAAALRSLRPDQLRAGAGQRRGAGAVRADQDVHRPRARGLSRPTRCCRPSAGRRR